MRVAGRGVGREGYLLRRVASVWIAVALVLGLSSGSALATAPGANGPIVFSSYGKIYTIQPDGSGLHQVVRADEEHKYDFYPSWAPDGQRIVTSGQMRNPDGYWTDMGLQVWVRFRAAVAEKVGLTIRRAAPPGRAFRCGREPGACLLTGQGERQAREGFNRISLSGLLGSAPTPGRYWLQLSSSSGGARAGLAFRVMPPRDRQRRSHSHRQAGRLLRASFHACGTSHRSTATTFPSGW